MTLDHWTTIQPAFEGLEARLLLAANAAPQITVPGAQAIDEDATLTFAGTISVADADADPLDVLVTLQASHGTITLSGTAGLTSFDGNGTNTVLFMGSLLEVNAAMDGMVYDPDLNYYGSDTLSVDVNDLGNTGDPFSMETDQDSVAITVNAVNDAPVGVADAYGVDEDGSLVVAAGAGVLANDTDVEDDALTAVLVADAAHGDLTLNADGSFTYDPDADFNGEDTFTYKANDGTDDSAVTTVTLTVNSVNDAPVGVADAYGVDEDGSLVVAAGAGVLANDTDVDVDELTAVLVADAAHGDLTLNADGSFTYDPDADFNGEDTFTYKANDGTDDSAVTTVTITVNAVNDAPVGVADAYGVDEDGSLVVAAGAGVLANDTDVEDDALTAVLVADAAHGDLTLNADGSFTYDPDADFNGEDTFTYKANDGTDDSAVTTVTLTVNAVNDAPSFTKGADQTVDEDAAAQTVAGWATGISAGPADEAGQTLTFVVTNDNNALFSVQPAIAANGTLTYTLAANANGAATVTVKLTDDGGGTNESAEQTFTITVNPVNDAPVGVADAYGVDEDGSLVVAAGAGVLANDTDVEDDALTAVLVADAAHGDLTLNADGSFTYDPDADFNGEDTFTYKANDGTDDSAVTTVTLTVNAVNDAPVGVADAYGVDEDGSLVVAAGAGVLANDTDVDVDELTAVLVADAAHGDLTLNADGSFTYTPDDNFNGTDTFTYKANDGTADSAVTTVTITVGAINDAPVITNPVPQEINKNGSLVFSSANGNPISIADVDAGALNLQVSVSVSHGTLTLATTVGLTVIGNGTNSVVFIGNQTNINAALNGLAYSPTLNYTGSDTLSINVSDLGHTGAPGAASASSTVDIGINAPPVGVADAYDVDEDGSLVVAAGAGVLANDTDAEDDDLTAVLVDDAAHGDLTLNADGSFTYDPDADFNGEDTFTYKPNDGGLDGEVTTVTLTVNAVNDAPSFTKGADQTADEDSGLHTVAGWATDISKGPADEAGQTLTFVVTNDNNALFSVQPAIAANGTLTYTLADDANGAATVTVKLTDDGGGTNESADQTFTVTVNAVNDAPSFTKGADQTVDEDAAA
ncbi:MAG: Ig-like domain-containing protein, partial [Phycisphaerae bacterium]